MSKFSDRIGVTKTNTELQVSQMNDELRNSLWNTISDELHHYIMSWYNALEIFYFDFFKETMDEIRGDNDCRNILRERFFKLEWYDVYNLTEFFLQNIPRFTDNRRRAEDTEALINSILARELSGYRSINLQLVPITNESEVASVQQAASNPSNSRFAGASEHINTALSLLGKRPDPDYRNSIKESISAVEGLCKVISGDKSGGLDKALSIIANSISIHGALKSGILNLYGYTSDEEGIRHPILEISNVGFPEAKFMLVTCSALVNFLIEKAHEAHLV